MPKDDDVKKLLKSKFRAIDKGFLPPEEEAKVKDRAERHSALVKAGAAEGKTPQDATSKADELMRVEGAINDIPSNLAGAAMFAGPGGVAGPTASMASKALSAMGSGGKYLTGAVAGGVGTTLAVGGLSNMASWFTGKGQPIDATKSALDKVVKTADSKDAVEHKTKMMGYMESTMAGRQAREARVSQLADELLAMASQYHLLNRLRAEAVDSGQTGGPAAEYLRSIKDYPMIPIPQEAAVSNSHVAAAIAKKYGIPWQPTPLEANAPQGATDGQE